tara:strand:- start:1021 stop:1479 length:459 start_codon:yes stop_codon:yes gene_type:complete
MKNFESYHIIGFLLAYISLSNSHTVVVPKIQTTTAVYAMVSLAPLLGILSTSDSVSIEHLLLVLSYACTERALGSLIVLNDSKHTKVGVTNYLHMIFTVSILILIYTQRINVSVGYTTLIAFTIFSFLSRKITVQFALQDYIIIHLLFFFAK